MAMVDVTLLGTAAALPIPDRPLTAAALTCGGRTILFDCGEGTQVAARRARVSLVKIDLIALTHYHGDHIFGIPGLLQSMALMRREAPLYLTGPGDAAASLAPLLRLIGYLPYPVYVLTLPAEGIGLEVIGFPKRARLTPIPTAHNVTSRGYLFELSRAGRFDPVRAEALGVPRRMWRRLQDGETVEADGRSVTPNEVTGPPRRGIRVVFSGDTAPCAALENAACGADLLIHEATFPDEPDSTLMAAQYGHTTLTAAASLAARTGARRVWLAHFSQSIRDPAEYEPSLRAICPPVRCGEPGMTAALDFDKDA